MQISVTLKMVILIDEIFLPVNLCPKENMIMAFRNIKTQKHRLLSISIQRTETNWPSYYSVYSHNSPFLSPSRPHLLPPLQCLTAKMGLGRMLESSQGVLSRGCCSRWRDQCNTGGFLLC